MTCCPAGAAAPADWPRWRGHEGAGQGGDVALPGDWDSIAWKWKAALPGEGHGSPVVFRGGVYTASADEATGTRFLTCLRVEALSTAGEPLWHADLGPYDCEHGFGASPAMWRDLVIVPIDHDGPSAIVALDAKTGRERWRMPRETARTAYSTPLVIDRGDGTPPQLVVASNSHGLTGLDPATGRLLWETRCFPRRTVSSPMLAAPLVIGTCGEGGGDNLLVALPLPTALPPPDAPPLGETCRATPAAAGGRIYFRTTRQLFAL